MHINQIGRVLTKFLTAFLADTRLLHDFTVLGAWFQALTPSFMNEDLRVFEPYISGIVKLDLDLDSRVTLEGALIGILEKQFE